VNDKDTGEGSETELAVGLIEGGSEIAGASVGAAVGLVGGVPGIVGGAAAGVAVTRGLKKVGAELRRRLLGPREQVRVGAAAAFAASRIAQLLEVGQTPREDGFFDAHSESERPAAEEVLEGVLLKARDAYEERKVKYLGNLYAHIAFIETISPAHANHLIELAAQLTYRQLVFLCITSSEQGRASMRDGDYRGDEAALSALGPDGMSLLTEVYDLYQRGLLHGSGEAWISVADVNPRKATAQGSGVLLVRLMGLNEIDQAGRDAVAALLAQ
jgi:hypothetical protein